jgi:hypothetical protein
MRVSAAIAAAATVIAVAVVPVATAHASGNPLAGLSADQIAVKAIANLKTTSSVHLTGTAKEGGQSYTISLSATPNGCDGTMDIPHTGSFGLLAIGKKVWIQPSNQFWKSEGVSGSELPTVSGKYIAVTGSFAKDLADFKTLCIPKDFASEFGGPVTGLVEGGTRSISGQPAVELKDASDSGYMYVSVAAKPEVLRIDLPGTASFSFSHYGAHVTLTPPPPGDVIQLPDPVH